jgi:uncharacterized protein YbaP (TraB family)
MQIVILVISMLIVATASSRAKGQENDEKNLGQGNSLLWKISGKGLEKPSFLFGTVHMICKDDYFWTDAMQNAYDNSEKVCFEMDLDDITLQASIASSLMLEEGQELKDFFNEADYEQLAQYLQDSLSMPIHLLSRMKPAAIMTLVLSKVGLCKDMISYESNIMSKAISDDKEILGLETVSEQIAILENMNTDSIVSYVMQIVNGNESYDQEFSKLMDAYKDQDLESLYQLIKESASYKDDLNNLLYDRNQRWIGRMEKMMKENSVFFGVGAGHLWGEKGLLEYLKDSGYTLEILK